MNDIESIRFKCPLCRTGLRVAAKAGGKRVRCLKCTKLVVVPDQSEVEEEQSELAAPRLIWSGLAGGAAVILLAVLGIWLVTASNRRTSPPDSPQVAAGPNNPAKPVEPDQGSSAETVDAKNNNEEERVKADKAATEKTQETERIKAEQQATERRKEEERVKAEQQATVRRKEEERIKAEQQAAARRKEEERLKAEYQAAQVKELTPLRVTRIKAEVSYMTDGGAEDGIRQQANTWGKIIQIIDDDNMLIGIDNGSGSPGGKPRYSVVVSCKFPTKGLTDGQTDFLAKILGTDKVTVSGTTRYKTAAGGTRTVFVLEPYGKKKK